jgi:hypothetical protein
VQQPAEVDARVEARRLGFDRLFVGPDRAIGVARLERDRLLVPVLLGRGRAPSNASRYWPVSARRWPTPSRTTTWSPTAPIFRPDSGMASGNCRRSAFSERVMRAAGTFDAASACAVRSTIRSWNENSQVLRGPRAGATKPALTSARIVLRGRRSSFSTSAAE